MGRIPRLIHHSLHLTIVEVPSNTRPGNTRPGKTHRVTFEPLLLPRCSCPGFGSHCQCDRAGHIKTARAWLQSDPGVGQRLEFVDAAIGVLEADKSNWRYELDYGVLCAERDALCLMLHQSAEAAEIADFQETFLAMAPRSWGEYHRELAL